MAKLKELRLYIDVLMVPLLTLRVATNCIKPILLYVQITSLLCTIELIPPFCLNHVLKWCTTSLID